MSVLSVTTITTPDTLTDLTLTSASGNIFINANGTTGTSGQALLSGVDGIYWGAGGGGGSSVGGSNTYIQFNDSGDANGVSGFRFYKDFTTLRLSDDTNNPNIQLGKVNGYAIGYTDSDQSFIINRDVPLGTGTRVLTISAAGALTMKDNITAYSDVKLKEDISTIDNALDKVSQMRGVMYTRKDTGERGTGVIAQEIRDILPEVVMENNDDILSVAYGNIVGVLIEAIKELKAEIEELKSK